MRTGRMSKSTRVALAAPAAGAVVALSTCLALVGLQASLQARPADPPPSSRRAGDAGKGEASKARPKVTRPEVALKLLVTGHGDELAEAIELLRGRPDLLKRHAKALAAAVGEAEKDPEVAARVASLIRDRGDEGCAFAASLVDPKHPTWVARVIAGFREMPSCPSLRERVMDVLRWLPDPDTSPEAARLASAVLAIVRADRESAVGKRVCRYVLGGPAPLRREAVDTLVAARPDDAGPCLVRAYSEARRSAASTQADLRRHVLESIAAVGGPDAIPTLVYALESPDDRPLACQLLREAGQPALSGMVFAVRSTDARAIGVGECLAEMGAAALPAVLPLADHPSQAVRDFVVFFLERYQSAEARKALEGRYASGKGGLKKPVLFHLLARYPLDEVRAVVESALSDPDPEMRLKAIEAIEAAHSRGFSKRLMEAAEEDAAPVVRSRALVAMWRLGDEAVVPLAIRQVQYEVPEVASAAALVLGFMGDGSAVPVLLPVLGAKDQGLARSAATALWVLTYQDPAGKARPAFRGPPKAVKPGPGREVIVPGGKATVVGDEEGTLAVVLPGGPGMDFAWARPVLDEVADTVAFLEPAADGDGERSALVSPEAFKALLQALRRPAAVVISDGIGGTAAMWLAVRVPEAVAGVVAIAAPLPGGIDAFDRAFQDAIPEPFKALLADVVKEDARFHPEALNRYVGRLVAPALAGPVAPRERVLRLQPDLAATGRARAVLSRPEVRFAPTELRGRMLWLGPLSSLPEDVKTAYLDLAGAAPDRVAVEDLPDCGFAPTIVCEGLVKKRIRGLVREAAGR